MESKLAKDLSDRVVWNAFNSSIRFSVYQEIVKIIYWQPVKLLPHIIRGKDINRKFQPILVPDQYR